MNEFEVGQLAQDLRNVYPRVVATDQLFSRPETRDLMNVLAVEHAPGTPVRESEAIPRLDGTVIIYNLPHYLETAILDPSSGHRNDVRRSVMGGVLITLGDALAAEGYFDHGPDLELVRHLRNGIAHGNRFNLLNGEPRRPAHFTGPGPRSYLDGKRTPEGQHTYFEVTPSQQGTTVLFDFMGPADILDLLSFISVRLIRIGNGDAPMDIYPQRP